MSGRDRGHGHGGSSASQGGGYPPGGGGGGRKQGGYPNQWPDKPSGGGNSGRKPGGFNQAPGGGSHPGGGGGGGGGGHQQGGQDIYSPGPNAPDPDLTVAKIEKLFQEKLSSRTKSKDDGVQLTGNLPYRPAFGAIGKPVTLWANYFEMHLPPNLVLYRYHIHVTPEARGKKGEQIIRLLLEMPGLVEIRNDLVTDFRSNLISRQKLAQEKSEFLVTYRAEKEDEPSATAQIYTIQIGPTGSLTVAQLTEFLTSTNLQSGCTEKLPIIQALNIVVRHYAKSNSNLAAIGASKTFSLSPNSHTYSLGAGLNAVRGFFSSVRAATSRILVNVNVSHGAFYQGGRLRELILSYYQAHGTKAALLERFLHKIRVKVIHLPERKNQAGDVIPRIKTIAGLARIHDGRDREHPPEVKSHGAGPEDVRFFLEEKATAPPSQKAGKTEGSKKGPPGKNQKGAAGSSKKGTSGGRPSDLGGTAGRMISVYDFFLQTYNRMLEKDLPVVNLGSGREPVYFPADVCLVLPGQNYRSALDPRQMQQMMNFAVRKPGPNARSIVEQGLPTVGLRPANHAVSGKFGISVVQNLITVAGRQLFPPPVRYQDPNNTPSVKAGSWNMVNQRFARAAPRPSVGVLVIYNNATPAMTRESQLNDDAVAKAFLNNLSSMGLAWTWNKAFEEVQKRLVNKNNVIETLDAMVKRAADDKVRLLLIVLPAPDVALYKHIKHLGDVRCGVLTVCVDGDKYYKRQKQYFANVALKCNLKLGGINQQVGLENKGIISEGKTMIVGLDVTHPSPGSTSNAPSVAGMVASIDKQLGQWPAALRIQAARQEMVAELGSMLKSRLKLWQQHNHNRLPENILVYRDGVSEGQYESVLNIEQAQMRQACVGMYPATDTKSGLPRFTIVVVGKRHHTRFYPVSQAQADHNANPQAGTVVDRGVTEARNWDFFMQAHAAIKGTARPAHYFVVLDEIFKQRKIQPGLPTAADVLEELTHHLCYLYGRATKAVSICMPAYYADIVCERARCYLSDLFDGSTRAETPAASEDGGGAPVVADAQPDQVVVHPNVVDTMFYI